MKRFTRRGIAVMVGLVLGWLAQGWTGGHGPGPNDLHASDSVHTTHPNAPHNAHDMPGTDDPGHHGEHPGEDPGVVAAELLAQLDQDAGWYRNVLWIAGGLFVAAVVIGIPALKLKGPEPPEPAADHDAAGAH